MWFKNLLLSIFLAVVFTWFAIANSQSVTLSVLIWRFNMSLSLVVLISALVGVIFTGLVAAMEQTRMYGKMKDVEGKLKHDEEILKKQGEVKK
jgi:uncharacterized integral membrane protein